MGNYAKSFRSLLIGVYKKGSCLIGLYLALEEVEKVRSLLVYALKAVKPVRFFALGLI
ncbi:Uncharacterised protein [Yersinia enterocolitica]|nr:Uncharacterised protein [Yersinia enterocolitica]CQD49231.1 Uncharacterised protein [Yersinia enterocolitica]